MRRTSRIAARFAAVFAAAGLALGGAAYAQEGGASAQGSPGAADEAAQEFSEQDLQKFAQVQTEIRAIGERYRPKLSNAEDSSAMQKIQQDMQEEMVKAVQDSGLDVVTYNSIARQAQTDAALREKLEGMD